MGRESSELHRMEAHIKELQAELAHQRECTLSARAEEDELQTTNEQLLATLEFMQSDRDAWQRAHANLKAEAKENYEQIIADMKEVRILKAEVEVYKDLERRYVTSRYEQMNVIEKLQAVVDASKHLVSKYRDELMHRCDVDALEQAIKEVE